MQSPLDKILRFEAWFMSGGFLYNRRKPRYAQGLCVCVGGGSGTGEQHLTCFIYCLETTRHNNNMQCIKTVYVYIPIHVIVKLGEWWGGEGGSCDGDVRGVGGRPPCHVTKNYELFSRGEAGIFTRYILVMGTPHSSLVKYDQ